MTPVFQGFPIRKSTDQSSFTSSPWLIAGYNVLHRLLVPRHPPTALSSLSKYPKKNTTRQKLIYKDARVHCEILKQRANPNPTTKQELFQYEHSDRTEETGITESSGPNNVLFGQTPRPTPCPVPLPHHQSNEGCTKNKNQTIRGSKSMFHNPEPPTQKTLVPDS